ncbi:hypothetical protein GCM10023143_18160 [Compostibacter hankyongensis]|uniref:Uncharacterized protein n=1 Tax=Compostibacter hankyongensis TaxID=1007089 RepID=A0ABP8FSS8_9BACT
MTVAVMTSNKNAVQRVIAVVHNVVHVLPFLQEVTLIVVPIQIRKFVIARLSISIMHSFVIMYNAYIFIKVNIHNNSFYEG